MILGGLCRTIYQGLRGLCIYGLSNSRSSAQIGLRETPTVLSKRPRSLSRQRNVVKKYGVKQTELLHSAAIEPSDPMWSQNKATGALYSAAVESTDPMWSQNKTTESLNSAAIEPTDPMWSQNKTTESLCSVAVQRTTERRYTANEALHDRSTNSEFAGKYGKYSNESVCKSRESRQAAKHSRKRERETSRIPAKKLLNAMRRKIRRKKIRSYVRRFIPRSSLLHDIIKCCKYWCLRYLGDKLYTRYAACMKCGKCPKRQRRCSSQAAPGKNSLSGCCIFEPEI